jgi:hypothetical protein
MGKEWNVVLDLLVLCNRKTLVRTELDMKKRRLKEIFGNMK